MEQDQVERIAAAFSGRPGVTRGRAFATDSLMVNAKIFALFRPEGMVFKLPRARVDALINSGAGQPFSNSRGPMKEWVTVPGAEADRWPTLAEEAFGFVGQG